MRRLDCQEIRMTQQPTPCPREHRPDDNTTRRVRDGHINDRRTDATHPDDDRLTEADLDRRERERHVTHAE
jgi:hypothetical protein